MKTDTGRIIATSNKSLGAKKMKLARNIILFIVAAVILTVGGFIALNWAPDRPLNELKARWASPPSVFIEIEGMPVHVRDEGPRDDPSPIVLLHGTSASLHTWEGWAAELKTKRRVIRFDLPGFGLTGPYPDNDYTLAHYARFINAALDKLGVAHGVLGGNSFGGQVALAATLAYPQRVDKLILVDSAGYAISPTSVPIGFRLALLPVVNKIMEVTLPRSVVTASVRSVYGDPARATPEIIDRYYQLALREGNRHALVERLKQILKDEISAQIPKVKVPTLILWGGRDQLIPPESGRRFQRDIAGSQLVMFDDLGHVPHEEDPLRTVATVKTFLGWN